MAEECALCQGRGLIFKDNYAIPCRCAKEKMLDNLYRQSCLPPAVRNFTFNSFDFKYYPKTKTDPDKRFSYLESARLTYNAAMDFVKNFPEKNGTINGLLFTGQVGSGKTFLACCIANALLERGHPVLFAVVPDMLDRIRATYDAGKQMGYSEQEVMDAARAIPLLILDDLGAHNYTDWTRNKLYSIINYRLNYCLPTVITTNISLENLEAHLGERTTSRIFQMCRPYRLLVDVDIRMLQG